MKKWLTGLCLLMAGTAIHAQIEIKVEEAAKHIGDSVKICTKIYGAKYFENGKNAPTLLNAGAKFPDAPLTLVIFGDKRNAFKNKPEVYYVDKEVCITGRIILFKDKPEIILTNEDQIVVKE